jgi:hypothetical protein
MFYDFKSSIFALHCTFLKSAQKGEYIALFLKSAQKEGKNSQKRNKLRKLQMSREVIMHFLGKSAQKVQYI